MLLVLVCYHAQILVFLSFFSLDCRCRHHFFLYHRVQSDSVLVNMRGAKTLAVLPLMKCVRAFVNGAFFSPLFARKLWEKRATTKVNRMRLVDFIREH